MKRKQFELDDVLEALRMAVEIAGSQAKCAEKLGVTQGYINDLLKKKREPGPKFLAALGMRKVVTYEYEVEDDAQEDRVSLEKENNAKGTNRNYRTMVSDERRRNPNRRAD